MAKCVKNISVVEKIIYTKVASYVLELSGEEALTLACVLNNVGGSPEHSLRMYTDSIQSVLLKQVGDIDYFNSYNNDKIFDGEHHSIIFKNDSNKQLKL